MLQIDWSFVSAITSSVTAIVAIAAPVITSISANRSQERIKKMEIHAPHVYDALEEMTQSYSSLFRSGALHHFEDSHETERVTQARFEIFRTAALKVLSLVPGLGIQQHITELLNAIRKNGYRITDANDKQFLELLSSINSYMFSLKADNEKEITKK